MLTPSPIYIYPTAVFLWAASSCSIGISSWQFQSYSKDSFKEKICDNFFEFIGPFAMNVPKDTGPPLYVYCGYSKVNTGFRICVGCIGFILSSALIYGKCSGVSLLNMHKLSFGKMTLKFFYIVLSLLWYCALCIDSKAMGTINDSQVSPTIN